VTSTHPIAVTGSSAINLMGQRFQFLYLIIRNIILLSSDRAILHQILDITCVYQSCSFQDDRIT